ncbi:putative ATP-dependent zinc protease [Pseudomonas coronafaciens pv. coronafaciens]|nr:putative ATP-dependent zinc protease [Pseudomonas coronafaciens pv. garcae]RMN92665.1 putative ATP-dependent zinc protease [Pseudomonas coronafaciens pv. coronafaciens]RMS96465.1 putative ATP-dependent zinc protease [Pseudomonas coronafaciens pv. oryzae]RMT00392.1 putative ATP-dependent zinc protease [Pseudomonas coronafaciens pv. oryzae]
MLIAPGFMRLTTFFTLLCLLSLPGLTLAANKTVYGLNEYARLTDIDVEVAAKLDTGAKTASLSARDIKHFKRNGESWVRFYVATDRKHVHPVERPLARVSKIKRRADDLDPDDDNRFSSRPVITLDICMGEVLRTIEVNLTDRSAFQYPLLIGSEALKRFDALVDPSLKYAAGKPVCASVAQNAE